MFRQPDFSNLRFNIIQAVNPYIQNSSNKCFGKSISSLPNNKVKSTINLLLCVSHFEIKYRKFDTQSRKVLKNFAKI